MDSQDARAQLRYLFFSNLVILFVGMGLFPLLPVYAGQFGATSTTVGIYMALTYVSITAGTALSSWLAERLTRKGLFVTAGLLGIPALVLMGQATELWHVVILTGIIWFSGGVGIALVSVLTGLYADKESRGRSFGLLSLTTPLGAVFGGTVVGRLVEWQGYELMFVVLALVWTAWPVIALLKVKDNAPAERYSKTPQNAAGSMQPARPFHLLLVAALMSALTVSVGRLGLSLTMKANQFAPGAITGATVVGGLVTIPVVLGLGSLSDRAERKHLLALGYLLAAGGTLTLGVAGEMWHFWLAAALLLVALGTNQSIASAFATDYLAPEALSRGLPRLNTMNRVSGIVGFAGTGYMMDTLGATQVFLIAAAFSIVAASLLELLPSARQTSQRLPHRMPNAPLAPCPEVGP